MAKNDKVDVVIRDLIYFDVSKAESILSQIEGGLISEIEASSDTTQEKRNIRNYDLKLFKPEFGGTKTETETTIERRRRHHEMCTLLEDFLLGEGFAIDINKSVNSSEIWSGEAHKRLAQYGYVKAQGWVSVEDYTRLQFILKRYNSILEFVNKSQVENLPQFQVVKAQIETLEEQLTSISDRNKRSKPQRELNELKKTLQRQTEAAIGQSQIQDWLVNGIDNLIESFLKERLNLFVFPLDACLPFYFLSSLKRSCFVDTDIDNFIYSYGSRPNLKLTVLGLITSLPNPDVEIPDFKGKFDVSDDKVTEQTALEKGFGQVFDGLQGVNRYFSFSHFPNVTLYPIAVYREVSSQNTSST